MEKVNFANLPGKSQPGRGQLEAEAYAGLKVDGRARLKRAVSKTESILYRCTPQKRAQLVRLADRLSVGKADQVSFIETIDRALDLLEKAENERMEVKGKKSK